MKGGRFAGQGYHIMIHCRHSLNNALDLAEGLNLASPDSESVFQGDLNHVSEINQLIVAALSWRDSLDLVVNNAFVFVKNTLQAEDEDSWKLQFNTNVKIPYQLSLAGLCP